MRFNRYRIAGCLSGPVTETFSDFCSMQYKRLGTCDKCLKIDEFKWDFGGLDNEITLCSGMFLLLKEEEAICE